MNQPHYKTIKRHQSLIKALHIIASAQREGRALVAGDLAEALGLSSGTEPGLRRQLVGAGLAEVVIPAGGGVPATIALTTAAWAVVGDPPTTGSRWRKCLGCGARHWSWSAGHRLCDGCRSSAAPCHEPYRLSI